MDVAPQPRRPSPPLMPRSAASVVAVQWQIKANALYTDAENQESGKSRLKLYQGKKPFRY